MRDPPSPPPRPRSAAPLAALSLVPANDAQPTVPANDVHPETARPPPRTLDTPETRPLVRDALLALVAVALLAVAVRACAG